MRKQIKRTAATLTALVLAVSLLGGTALTAAAEELPPGPAPAEATAVAEAAEADETRQAAPPAEVAEVAQISEEPPAEAAEVTVPPEPPAEPEPPDPAPAETPPAEEPEVTPEPAPEPTALPETATESLAPEATEQPAPSETVTPPNVAKQADATAPPTATEPSEATAPPKSTECPASDPPAVPTTPPAEHLLATAPPAIVTVPATPSPSATIAPQPTEPSASATAEPAAPSPTQAPTPTQGPTATPTYSPTPSPGAQPAAPTTATPATDTAAVQLAALAEAAAPASVPDAPEIEALETATDETATPEIATPETAASAPPTATPAPTQQTLTAALFRDIDCTEPLSDGTVITLEGLLPTGGSARAVPVEAALADENQTVLAAYDITVLDAAGEEWQPAEADSIAVGITAPALTEAVRAMQTDVPEDVQADALADPQTPEQADPQTELLLDPQTPEQAAQTISIYHVDGGDTPATVAGDSAGASIIASDVALPEGDEAVRFTAEGFSVYLLTMERSAARCRLCVENKTTGDMGDRTYDFTYTVWVEGVTNTEFTLHNGESRAFELQAGKKVTVTLTPNNEGYTTTITKKKTTLKGNSYTYIATKNDHDVKLVFTNDRALSPDTGLAADAAPYAAMLLTALCAAVLLRKRQRE